MEDLIFPFQAFLRPAPPPTHSYVSQEIPFCLNEKLGASCLQPRILERLSPSLDFCEEHMG